MLEPLGSLLESQWMYALVALSVVLDVFLPVLPSGVLVVTAVTAVGAGTADGPVRILLLLLCTAAASCLGDYAAFRLARRRSEHLERLLARSKRLTRAQERFGKVLSRGGATLFLLARFAPAGRSVLSLGAGSVERGSREFLCWSGLAGIAWAGYSVGLGYLGSTWIDVPWLTPLLSVLAFFGTGALAARALRGNTPARQQG
ncbi:DedA family protein [Streptomyces sp. NPDC059637]|uniref:DedA family protein n=1 Tax=Streptomyces TaxID=1883 RepID=UPI0031DB2667